MDCFKTAFANKNKPWPGKNYCQHNLLAPLNRLDQRDKAVAIAHRKTSMSRVWPVILHSINISNEDRISASGFAMMKAYSFPARPPSLSPPSPDKQVHKMPRRFNSFIWHSMTAFNKRTNNNHYRAFGIIAESHTVLE